MKSSWTIILALLPCLTQFTVALDDEVRLVGGAANHLGRVEILYSGEWGTVCDNRWSKNDGHVVCRMLGFSKAIQIFKSSAFKGGSGKIWLTKLNCNGTENSLFNCQNAVKFLGDTGCTHEQDAGVECLKDEDKTGSCSTQTLTQEGSFHSPNYPRNYPMDAVCYWIIKIPQEMQLQFIKLTFEAFQLEYGSSCAYDQLTAFDGEEGNKTMLGRFCGVDIPPPLFSSSDQMVVKFTSDSSMAQRGFNATFEFTNVLVPADILLITSEQSVVFGADVKLDCWSKGVPTPDVAWMRNGKVLVKGERTVILKLDNVTWQDEDVYTCVANNSGGSDTGETNVDVVECPSSCKCFSATDELRIDCKSSNITSVPLTIPGSVTEIDLSDNRIATLNTEDLKSLKKLQKLYLSNNDIKRLRNGTFQDTGALEEIFLARNEINVLEEGSFTGLEYSLVILFLSNNFLTSLTSGVFNNLTSLKYLFLSNNDIVTVDSLTFMGLTSLMLINLADNPITTLQKKAFSINDTKLQTIYLMNTKFEKLNLRAFDGHKNVKTYISPDNVDDGIVTNQKGLFIALTEAGFAAGNESYRSPCPTGTFVPHLENFKYNTALEAECIPCPPGGFYSDSVAHVDDRCFLCNPGTYVPPERAPGKRVLDCHVCPTGTRTNLDSGYRACKCIEGFHRQNRFGPCKSCPSKGLDCVNESVSLKKGYYWQWDSEESMLAYKDFADNLKIENNSYSRNTSSYNGTLPRPYQCPHVESCEGGLESKCAKGYSGPLCEVCESGYYKRVLSCKACPSGTWVIVQLCVLGLVVLVLIAILIWNGRRKKTKRKRPMIDILLARLKIVIGFYQVTSGIVEAFVYVKWPSSLSMIGDYAEVIQLNILQFVPLHCLFPSWKQDAFSNMYVIVGSNACVIIFAFVAYWIRKLFLVRKLNKDSPEMRNKSSTAKEFLYRNVFLFLFITYPSTCSTILRTLPLACHQLCTENSCTFYLKADYGVKCEGETYEFFKVFAFAASSYIVLLPALVVVALWRRRRQQLSSSHQDEDRFISNMVDPEFGVYADVAKVAEENDEEDHDIDEGPNGESELISGMSFLYENYNDDAWYWELVEVVRKLVLTCGIILIGRESRAYVGLASICSGLFAIAYAFRKPIKDEFEDKLQLTALLVIFLNLGIGVILKIPKESVPSDVDEHLDSLLVNILVVGANVLVILLVVGRYLAVLIHNFLLWRRNPQCSASCCITMLLSLNELGSGVNSVAAGGKSSLKVHMGIGRVDMPSMRAAVSDNVGFEIEENGNDATKEKNKEKILKAVRFMSRNEHSNEMDIKNRAGSTGSEGRRFSRFPTIRSGTLDS